MDKEIDALREEVGLILKDISILNYDLSTEFKKLSNEQIIEQMESDQQRRTQYDKDFKQLQQQLNNSYNKEKICLLKIKLI